MSRAPAPGGARGRILVVGATSPVARAVAAEFARDGHPLLLTGRDEYELGAVASDLAIRFGVDVARMPFDVLEFDRHAELVATAEAQDVGGTVLAVGTMGDQTAAQADFGVARPLLEVNYTACVSLLEGIAGVLERRGSGFVCAIGSVAGDRGRGSNYLYGSAKAGLATFLQGLRNRLHGSGISVTTVKPGFVDTRMTYGAPGVFLVASPESVGRSIRRAVRRRRSVVYVPWFWRIIMGVIRCIPEPVFKRMTL